VSADIQKLLVAFWSQSWPTQPWPTATQLSDIHAVSDMDPGAVLLALQEFRKLDPKGFRPTPGQLRAIVHKADPAHAEVAWRAFLKALAHYGGAPNGTEVPDAPKFVDVRIVETVRRLGGFRQFLRGMDAQELERLRWRFLRVYADVLRGKAQALPEPKHAPLVLPPGLVDRIGGGGR